MIFLMPIYFIIALLIINKLMKRYQGENWGQVLHSCIFTYGCLVFTDE